jgi:hypothetical protein
MKLFVRLIVLNLLLALPLSLVASVGAHGPNGEHLDAPAASAVVSDGRPRMEAFTELFELVAHLDHDALTAMIDVYQTNAPVDGANVEAESNGIRAKAKFDPVTGIYRFAEPKLIAALSKPGKHALAFTVTAGDDFDIVAGAMDVADQTHAHVGGGLRWWLPAAGLLLLLVAIVFVLRRRRSGRRPVGVRA